MKKRERYLDLVRCIAIVLVIGLHVISPYLVQPAHYGTRAWLLCVAGNALFRAGVPLFFMISGYLMLSGTEAEDTFGFYRRRLPRILLPLLCWNVIYTYYYALSQGRAPSPAELLGNLLNKGSAYHMWYVYTLLGVYLMTPFLRRVVQGCERRELIVLFALVIFPGTIRTTVNTFLPVYVYLFEPLMEGYFGYYLLGYLLGTVRLTARQRAGAYLLGGLGAAVSIVMNIRASSPEQIALPFNQGYAVTHYLCAAAIFIACKELCTRLPRFGAVFALPSGLVFGVYWVHVLVLETLSRLTASLGFPPAAYGGLLMLLTTLISFAAAFLMSRARPIRRFLM